MPRPPVLLLALVVLFSATPGEVDAQSRYSMIGTDRQAAGPVLWKDDASRSQKLAAILEAWARDDGFSGVALAASDGQIEYRGAFGTADRLSGRPITLSTPFRLGFMSSYYTAVSVGLLAQQGHLSFDDPIGRHLDGLRTDIGAISVRQYLAGRDGLDRNLWRHTEKTFADPFTRQELVALVHRLDRLAEPGELYQGPGPDGAQPHYLLLGWLVERLSGQPFEEYVEQRVLEPLGLRHTGFLTRGVPSDLTRSYHQLFGVKEPYAAPHPSHLFSSGAVHATIDDFYRFYRFVHQVVDQERLGDRALEAFKLRSFDLAFAVVDGSLVLDEGIPEGARTLHTGGSNGWVRGETILYQHIFETADVVIVLSNVHRAAEIYDIRRRWARLRFDLPVGAPLPKTRARLWSLLRDSGVEAAADFFSEVTASGAGAGDLPWPDQFMHHARELRAQKRYSEALLATELYLRTQPEFYLPYREMGEIYRAMGETGEAVRYFRLALELEPDDIVWKREMEDFVAEHSAAAAGQRP